MKTFVTNGNHVELFVPLMKFDERTGEFEARSTVEEIDAHNEICDVEKSWPALVTWAAEQEAISQGKSVGNLRVQHRRDTIGGTVTAMERIQHEGKDAVHIKGLITNAQAQIDAAKGAITGISIRGLADRWEEPDNPGVMRYAWTLVEEKSLVDRPAVPHALIEVLKADGGKEIVKAEGRQPTQFWDCGIEVCHGKHIRKDEAIKCEGVLPSRIEAKKAETEAKKSLWRVADLVSALTTLLYVLNDSQWEEAWRQVENGESDPTIMNTLKESAQKMFDAIQKILADERVASEIDSAAEAAVETATTEGEGAATEMAMSATMRALAKSPIAKQLLKSLRVPSGNGSSHTTQEGTVKKEEKKKEEAASGDDVATKLAEISAQLADCMARLTKLEDASKAEGEGEEPKEGEETAKSIAAIGAQLTAITKRLDEQAKPNQEFEELKKSVTDLAEGFNALVGALPMKPKGQLRAVSKEDDEQSAGGDTKKSETEKTVRPFVDLVERVV